MKLVSIIITLFCTILISCDDNKSIIETEDSEKVNQKVRVTATTIASIDYIDYALSPEGEKSLTNWEEYHELAIQIGFLKKGDLSFFNGDKELLKNFIDAFKVGIPDEFKTNPIVSRTVIIETMLLKFNENSTLDNIDGNTKLLGVKEILIAFSNLNYQINKKLERNLYEDIQPQ